MISTRVLQKQSPENQIDQPITTKVKKCIFLKIFKKIIYANASIMTVLFSGNQKMYDHNTKLSNLTFVSNSIVQILIAWQPDGVNL